MNTAELSYSDFDKDSGDAYVIEKQLDHPYSARVYCKSVTSYRVCNAWWIYIDIESLGMSIDRSQRLLCHEGGHTIGLLHGAQAADTYGDPVPESYETLGCMGSSSTLLLGDHNMAQINATY